MTEIYLDRLLDPWREFEHMSRLFDTRTLNGSNKFPAVNVWVAGEGALITTEIPGVDRNVINIDVAGNTVTLSGSRPREVTAERESYHRHELWQGEFSKTIKLPFNIDAEKVHASFKKGVLHISLPQLEADKPRKISINS